MASPSITDLITDATASSEPRFTEELRIATGGVDPLGLRQINFDLMDLVLPGLNNVARHIRPYTLIAWAWRRAASCAQASGRAFIPASEIIDVVDRIEVLFTWSQFLRDPKAELPGRDIMAPLLRKERFAFSGTDWKKMCTARRYSTSLSAPVNYGPAVKFLGWIEPTERRGLFRSCDRVKDALDAFERSLGNATKHPAFSQLGEIEVTHAEVLRWSDAWNMTRPTSAEKVAMLESFTGLERNAMLPKTAHCIAAQVRFRKGIIDVNQIRRDLCGSPSGFRPTPEFACVCAYWRNIQLRQLFRLSLEAALYWATAMTSERPYQTDDLVQAFLATAGTASTVSDWLLTDPGDKVNIPDLLTELQTYLDQGPDARGLAGQIRRGLAISLSEQCEDVIAQSRDRLPLSRARQELAAFLMDSPSRFVHHLFSSWVFGQHIYWAIGRGLGDARSRGKMILRLRVVAEEGGWVLAPGANARSVPRATPDRLETAVTLLDEAGLFEIDMRA